jgi:hypothetical protein
VLERFSRTVKHLRFVAMAIVMAIYLSLSSFVGIVVLQVILLWASERYNYFIVASNSILPADLLVYLVIYFMYLFMYVIIYFLWISQSFK